MHLPICSKQGLRVCVGLAIPSLIPTHNQVLRLWTFLAHNLSLSHMGIVLHMVFHVSTPPLIQPGLTLLNILDCIIPLLRHFHRSVSAQKNVFLHSLCNPSYLIPCHVFLLCLHPMQDKLTNSVYPNQCPKTAIMLPSSLLSSRDGSLGFGSLLIS